ncbi:MAG: RNA polymerase sigma-54 factor [Alphaproteobacteria bacterium]
MALGPKIDLRQGTALVMTPQLQQAIRLLQLSNLDIADYVLAQAEQNPLLDVTVEAAPGGEADDGHSDDSPPNDDGALSGDGQLWDEDAPAGAHRDDGASRRGTLDRVADDALSLRDHLVRQVGIDIRQPADRALALQLIAQLDDAGYLPADTAALASRLGVEADRMEGVISRLQQFDPPGIFARSIAECLALQLKDRGRLDQAMGRLLDSLDLLARRDLTTLARKVGVRAAELARMVAELRTLDPKPATAFDPVQPVTVVPDVLMRRARPGRVVDDDPFAVPVVRDTAEEEESWVVELNQATLPRVLVDRQYVVRLRGGHLSSRDRDYLNEQLQAANWLVRALDQRARTILKVASEIVRRQHDFFIRGVDHLVPLTLREVAEAVDMHESTVSRVTANKYMATPRGTLELKYFFSAAISAVGGERCLSAESIRHRIRQLIEAEDCRSVLSDDQLVCRLRADGVAIARRTVAKYREAMRIPPSHQRRREKTSIL